jgi:hypothetical protein
VHDPSRGAYPSVNQVVQVVLDHSWHPEAGSPAQGDAVCWHLPFRDGCVACRALDDSVFDCSVHAWVLAHCSFPDGCCGGDACQVLGADRTELAPRELWLEGLNLFLRPADDQVRPTVHLEEDIRWLYVM